MILPMALILLALIGSTLEFPIVEESCGAHQQCNNHGICTQFPQGRFCVCDVDWVGVRCQIAREKYLNGTKDEPCQNFMDCNDHGSCSGNGENLQCNCFEGWLGVRCIGVAMTLPLALMLLTLIVPTREHPVVYEAPCESNERCNGHGTCMKSVIAVVTLKYCVCDADWLGMGCQIPKENYRNVTIDESSCEDLIDCNASGFCSGNVDNLECNCYWGWGGDRCQIADQRMMDMYIGEMMD